VRKKDRLDALNTEDMLRLLEMERELARVNARSRFAHYLDYINPKYDRRWFHTLIADKCQQVFEGKIKRLMVFVSPQHGKSEIVSRQFPAWALGRNPDLKIVAASYSSDLVCQFGRSIQMTMKSQEYNDLFTFDWRKKGYKKNADLLEIPDAKGFYKAVGVTGSLTGTPADIAIIDDPVKDALEAYSPTYRERVWDWYTSVLMTRLHNDSRQLFIMTRWHEDDLAGRILKREADQWEVVTIPAIRETLNDGNKQDPRKVGEALWEERHSLESLLGAQQRSPRFFSALYQQHPTIEGGNIIKSQWFGHITMEDFNDLRLNETMHFFLDTAYTEKTANDPSGIIACCMIRNSVYIYNAKKVNMKFPDLCRFLPKWVGQNYYNKKSTLRIEPKANGLSVIDQLREDTNLNVTKTPTPTESKETRLNVCSPFVESGRVILVEGDWNEGFVQEVCGFPAETHDEYVDVMCYAIDFFTASSKGMTDEEIEKLFF
jgi:predicted phage terminase large subunit-like protein